MVIMDQSLSYPELAQGEPRQLMALLTLWAPVSHQSGRGGESPVWSGNSIALKDHFILKGDCFAFVTLLNLSQMCKPPILLKDWPFADSVFKQPGQGRANPNTRSVSAVCGCSQRARSQEMNEPACSLEKNKQAGPEQQPAMQVRCQRWTDTLGKQLGRASVQS